MSKFISENHHPQKRWRKRSGRRQKRWLDDEHKEGSPDPLRSPDKTLAGMRAGNWKGSSLRRAYRAKWMGKVAVRRRS